MGLNEKFFKTVADTPIVATDNFMPVVYSGNGTSSNQITTVGFEPDFMFLKNRTINGENGAIVDVLRNDLGNILYPNLRNAEGDFGSSPAFTGTSNGFNIGSGNLNISGTDNYVSWCWKAGGAATVITNSSSSVSIAKRSANAAAGFSIVSYTIDDNTPVVVPHGLNSTPKLAILKKSSGNSDWFAYNTFVSGKGRGFLNNDSQFDNAGMPTLDSTNITFQAGDPHSSGDSVVIYFFADVAGYQKNGAFNGTGSGNHRIYTTDDGSSTGSGGFQPRFILIKPSYSDSWRIFDSVRGNTKELRPNTNLAETTQNVLSFNSDGFTLNGADANSNISGFPITYLAIA